MRLQGLVKASKALSDETRLRVLNLLVERECCVCEVMQALEISQSRASRNLGILEDAGFLRARRDGAWVLYSLDEESGNPYAAALAPLLREMLDGDQALAADRARLRNSVRSGPGCRRR